MHAQPGTIGYPENNDKWTLEYNVTITFPISSEDALNEYSTVQTAGDNLAADIVDVLQADFRAVFVDDVQPEIGVRFVRSDG